MTTYPTCVQTPDVAQRQINEPPYYQGLKNWIFFLLFTIAGHFLSTAQCVAPYMSFHSPVLIAGTDNQVGAVYLFQEVMPGVDANIKIIDLVGGAQLYNIDDSTGIGYYDAFQPYVVAAADSVSYIDWEINFKVAGTSTDTSLSCFAITGVDIDGNGSSLQEFIEAATPGSYALDPATILSFSFDGVRSKAISQVSNIPSIDTAHREAMFQMNFQNISTLQYRNGAISTFGADMVRQTCIYFNSFFDNYSLLLPVKLISFSAQPGNTSVVLNWSATDENDLKYYTVQKSTNGNNWKDIGTAMPGKSVTNNYFITDAEKNAAVAFYRLRQTARTGQPVYSTTLKINPGAVKTGSITCNTIIKDAINMQITTSVNDMYSVDLYGVNGSKIKQQKVAVYAGYNTPSMDMPAVGKGLYVLTVKNSRGALIYQSKLVKD